jgi:hypothetical protein
MKFPRAVLLVIVLFATPAICLAQEPAKESTASIAGHVTLSGKAAAGVTVVGTLRNSFFDNKTVAKTTTDEDGNYKLTGLPVGNLMILPLAKAYVVANGGAYKEAGQSVNVTEGETITKIDFALVRGGVVTGRITDAEGHPLIGEKVSIVTKDSALGPASQCTCWVERKIRLMIAVSIASTAWAREVTKSVWARLRRVAAQPASWEWVAANI